MLKKAIVMAGGKATRLNPLSVSVNKHMLPVFGKPMIHWGIDALVRGGITEILVLLNGNHAQQVMEFLEDGGSYGVPIVYGYQRDISGLMRHIQAGRTFTKEEDFVLMLGDSLYLTPVNFAAPRAPHMWAMQISDGFDEIAKYAQVEIGAERVIDIMVEESSERLSGIIQTGTWVFPPDVFDRAESLFQKSEGEVKLRTLVHEYIREGVMTATMLPPRLIP